jgi:hypothetical protein
VITWIVRGADNDRVSRLEKLKWRLFRAQWSIVAGWNLCCNL